MILSDGDIRRRLQRGDLVLEPLDDPDLQIQPASVDMRLGREFLEFKNTNLPCIHPMSGPEVADYVSKTKVGHPGQATLSEWTDDEADRTIEQDEFILHPGDFVLGTTKERVEIPDDLIAHVEGRSSLGRLAIVVHASLPYDEEVFLWTPDDGFGFHEIGSVVEHERPAHAVSFDPRTLRVGTHRVTNFIRNPTRSIYRVVLESGRAVHVTSDHNLFTLDDTGGVTRVPSEAAVGRHVMVPDRLPGPRGTERALDVVDLAGLDETGPEAPDGVGDPPPRTATAGTPAPPAGDLASSVPANPRIDVADTAVLQRDTSVPSSLPVTPEFGWVLGRYIADGSAGRTQLTFDQRDRADRDRVAEWFERFDAPLSSNDREEASSDLTVSSPRWSRIFRQLAGSGAEKTVPSRAWNWTDEVLEELLAGMVAGDGPPGEASATLTTGHAPLANHAMYLGTRVGYSHVRTGRTEPSQTAPGDTWCEGGLTIEFGEASRDSDQSVPVPSELLRSLRSEAELGVAEAASAMDFASESRIADVEHGTDTTVSWETLSRFRETYADADAATGRLDQILDGDVRFEEVVAVEATDRVEPTYDLEVQPHGRAIENFVAGRGGIFLSNTAGIVDPGYHGQITLELSNLGKAPVALQPDMRISQLTFTELKNRAEVPYGAERGSKYQGQTGPQASRIEGDREFGGGQ